MLIENFGWRHVQVLLAFTSITTSFVFRISMSIAIVAMTNKANANPNYPEFDWNEKEKSTILSSFFWGYLLLQIIAGNLAEKYGSKGLLLLGMMSCSLLTLIIPVFAHFGFLVVCALRILLGIFQGMIFPCCTVLLTKWTPPNEKGRAFTIAFTGTNVGPLIAYPLAGYLAQGAGGWPSVFYVSGGLGVLWCLTFFYLGASAPSEHGRITDEEKSLIETSLRTSSQTEPSKRTPWKEIVTSLPLWAIFMAHLGQNWGFWTLATQTPNYIDAVFKFHIKDNGFLTCLPYLAGCFTAILFSWIADTVNERQIISRTVQRKIWNSIAAWGGAASLFILGISKSDNAAFVIAMLVITMALNSGTYIGFLTNHSDLSPNFCGTLMGITNSLSSITSILGPLCVGWLVTQSDSQEQWSHVFFVSAAVFFIGNLIYVMFSSSEVQSWDNQEAEREHLRNQKHS